MSAVLLAQQILNGLLDGVYYLLIALGLSLIFSLGGIVNLAHGAFYAIGAYLTLVLSPYLGFGGSFVAAPVVVALFGVVIERTLFSRFYRSDPILSLLMTFGLAMLLPRSAGGEETEPAVYVAAIEELAQHDASVAWNVFVANSSALIAAYLEPAVNHAVFANPRSIVAWGPPNASRASAVDAG